MTDLARIEQCVSGYVRGHGTHASSCDLGDARHKIDCRSDLSGFLPFGLAIPEGGYLRVYPVGTWYAVAKTWPDHSGTRAGTVVTHTLLLPGISSRSLDLALPLLSRPPDGLAGVTRELPPLAYSATRADLETSCVPDEVVEHLATGTLRDPHAVVWDAIPHDAVAAAVWRRWFDLVCESGHGRPLELCTWALREPHGTWPHTAQVAPSAARAAFLGAAKRGLVLDLERR